MNYDSLISHVFFKNKNHLNKSIIVKYNRFKGTKYINLHSYIMNRYIDSSSDRETLYRIHFHIEKIPLCPVCGRQNKFVGKNGKIYLNHCSNKCKKLDHLVNDKWRQSLSPLGTNRDKFKVTMAERYGVENPWQIQSIVDHIREINKAKKDISIKKQMETCMQKYGVNSYMQTTEFKQKSKETSLAKYGFIYPIQSPMVKNKYDRETIVKKINETKRKNNSFNQSKEENKIYMWIKKKYPDVQRQFRSGQYPFNCDFYIPSLDLYIECNLHWTHGGRAYSSNEEDLHKVEQWRSKHTKYYDNAIQTWMVRDVKKRQIAKKNNLNYIEIFKIDDLLKDERMHEL